MVAIKGVAHFSIPVSDVATSTRFYTEIVGCRHLSTVPRGDMAFLDALATAFGSIAALLPADTGSFVQIGVSMTSGWTVLTRIPSDSAAHSIATAFANSRTPPFVAQ
jgi:catechol 2,3-dioxygenase-like lactoylglutathione lyase family enzyme